MSVFYGKNRGSYEEDTSEFEGIWVNLGVYMGEEGDKEPPFVRLPRGVAVSDLKPRKVYDNMDPEFAAQVILMNQIIELIQQKGLELNEGESVPINLEAVIYRRKEEVAPTKAKSNKELATTLFG